MIVDDIKRYFPLKMSDNIYLRQSLSSSCTLPYQHQWFEFIGSFPFSSLYFLRQIYSNEEKYSVSYKRVFWCLFAVEVSHSVGHLFLFQYVEEVIIFSYFWFNLFFMSIVYESPHTKLAWWRSVCRSKHFFLFCYCCGAVILIYAWAFYGYLASTVLQAVVQLGVAWSTTLDTKRSRMYMHQWSIMYLFGVTILVSEIVGCGQMKILIGNFPYHACVDLIMGISCFYHSLFICELRPTLQGDQERKFKIP